MDITRDNYESWAVSYLEGTLDVAEGAMFMLFLAQNPDIMAEIELLRTHSDSEPDLLSVKSFAYLKKDLSSIVVNENTIEEFCIAYHEGDLDADTKKTLKDFIAKNQEYKPVFYLYEKLKVKPISDRYKKKKALYREEKYILLTNKRRALVYSFAAAASILLLAGWFFVNQSRNVQDVTWGNKPDLAESNSVAKNISETEAEKEISMDIPQNKTIAHSMALSKKTMLADKISEEVVDTTGDQDVFIPANRIEISRVKSQTPMQETILIPPAKESVIEPEQPNRPQLAWSLFQKKSAEFFDETTQLSVNQVLEKGVNSINQLTEANLQFESETDEEGRIIAFALSSESFTIKRKVRSN